MLVDPGEPCLCIDRCYLGPRSDSRRATDRLGLRRKDRENPTIHKEGRRGGANASGTTRLFRHGIFLTSPSLGLR
jgi:hypothetical protein